MRKQTTVYFTLLDCVFYKTLWFVWSKHGREAYGGCGVTQPRLSLGLLLVMSLFGFWGVSRRFSIGRNLIR